MICFDTLDELKAYARDLAVSLADVTDRPMVQAVSATLYTIEDVRQAYVYGMVRGSAREYGTVGDIRRAAQAAYPTGWTPPARAHCDFAWSASGSNIMLQCCREPGHRGDHHNADTGFKCAP